MPVGKQRRTFHDSKETDPRSGARICDARRGRFMIHVTWLGSTYQAMRNDGFSFERLTASNIDYGSSG